MRFLLVFFILAVSAPSLAADFGFYRHQGAGNGPTLLVIGGVDGDEPGGFHAAATLITHYRVQQGELWIVPNLNFPAILERRRGNMNLKFAGVDKDDEDYPAVTRIQRMIKRPQVDLVLNLHDGSGFYRPERSDSRHGPRRWGQSCVIDQHRVPGVPFGNLRQLAQTAIGQINRKAVQAEHFFHLKNVKTAAGGDIPAQKSLSYFAVRHNKPALAVEASKSHPVHLRTYYHLLALESFMRQLNIRFSRDFELTPAAVHKVIRDDALIALAGDRVQLELNNMRPILRNFPLSRDNPAFFSALNPLISVQAEGDGFRIHYGNNRLALLQPNYVDLDPGLAAIKLSVDGQTRRIPFGSIIPVNRHFSVATPQGYRTNVVGFTRRNHADDGHVRIARGQLDRDYSIDRKGLLYRVEIYRDNRFSGMILVDFRPQSRSREPFVAQAARQQAIRVEHHN